MKKVTLLASFDAYDPKTQTNLKAFHKTYVVVKGETIDDALDNAFNCFNFIEYDLANSTGYEIKGRYDFIERDITKKAISRKTREEERNKIRAFFETQGDENYERN